MFRFTFLIFCAFINNIQTNVSDNYIEENPIMNIYNMDANTGMTDINNDRVTIHVFYESLCPYCRQFDTTVLRPTVQDLGPYLDLNLIPYGNAKTTYKNGIYYFECQHGPEECYGNKLHACAISLLNNMTSAVIFNSCLMDSSQPGQGSNDEAADNCGASLSIDSEQIKQCAKSSQGSQLLKYYGDLTHESGIHYVPYILINGVLNDGDHFKEDVCKAFRNPPPPCRK